MADLGSLRNALHNAIIKGLGSNPSAAWNGIKDYICSDKTSVMDEETSGKDVMTGLRVTGCVDEECRSLIDLCVDYENGLVLLKNACLNSFRTKKFRSEFENRLIEYAIKLETQPAFRQAVVPTCDHLDLAWIDDPEYVATNIQVKQFLLAMTQPGEPLADDDDAKQYLSAEGIEDCKSALKRLLRNKSPIVVEEVRERLKYNESAKKLSEPMLFLHILVEPDFNEESIYQFKAELIEEGASVPTGFDPARESGGAWPKGSIAELPLVVGRWHEQAKRLSAHKLYMEIFLPYSLLVESLPLEIAVPNDPGWETWEVLKLAASGPYVLRSLERARMELKRQLGQLRLKSQILQQGDSVLRPVSNDLQLEPNLLQQGLSAQDIAGFLMLHDLPEDVERRSALIWKIINSGTPLFSWWNTKSANHGEPKLSDEPSDRWAYLIQCLELNAVEHDIQQDIKAPAHVHFPEFVADTRFKLAGKAECKSWIHRVMILHDHPDRWPKSILYEQETGGTLQCRI